MLRMHTEDSKTSMCILKLDIQVTKLDQDAKKIILPFTLEASLHKVSKTRSSIHVTEASIPCDKLL